VCTSLYPHTCYMPSPSHPRFDYPSALIKCFTVTLPKTEKLGTDLCIIIISFAKLYV
jgi:hypothetical protein